MSYASVAAHNAPPLSQQPHPNPALLTTEPPSASNIADDAAKLSIVSSDFKRRPATTTSLQNIPSDVSAPGGQSSRRCHHVDEVEQEGLYFYNFAKRYILHPAVGGGLLGLVNIGLISGAAYKFSNDPFLRRDMRAILSAVAGAFALLGVEGYAAEKYRETPRGRREAEKVKTEGAALYRTMSQYILRPGVLGGLLGLVNVGVLGSVGYLSWKNWYKSWDRRIVSAVTVGFLALLGGEGAIAERYRNNDD